MGETQLLLKIKPEEISMFQREKKVIAPILYSGYLWQLALQQSSSSSSGKKTNGAE